MKRILILVFIFFGLNAYSQRSIFIDSIEASGITGSDTSLYHTFYSKVPYMVIFDFTTLDCNDSYLIVKDMAIKGGVLYRGFDRDIYPVTLDKSSNQFFQYDNTDTTYTYIITGDTWGSEYLMYEWNKGSCTSGSLKKIIVK